MKTSTHITRIVRLYRVIAATVAVLTAMLVGAGPLLGALVAEWTFDDTLADATGNGNGGTIGAGTTFSYVPGMMGNGISMVSAGGSGQGVQVPYSTALFPATYTESVWVKFDASDPGYQGIMCRVPGSHASPYAFIRDGSDLYRADLKTSGANVGNSTWYHVVMMGEAKDGGALQFYVNGVAYSTTGSGNSWGSDPLTDLLIGGGNFAFNGVMDDVSMWSNTLASTQVKALYNVGTNGSLHYTAGNAASLFAVFDGSLASATIDALTWTPASGLTGNAGDVVDLLDGNFALILDDASNGVRSAPGPFVAITNSVGAITHVPPGTTEFYIAGTNKDLVVGGMTWTSSRGGGGAFNPVLGGWNFTATLLDGFNVISVSGTNTAGDVATDSVTVYCGGLLCIDITNVTGTITTTNDSQYIAGTNNEFVVGMMTWNNSRGGSGTLDPALIGWSFDVPLFNGTNVITVTGTNDVGDIASDTVTVYRPVPFSDCTLVAEWTFDDTLADATGNGNDGSLGEGTSNSYVTGVMGNAIALVSAGGSVQGVQVPYNAALFQATYTESVWVKFDASDPGYQGIMCRVGGSHASPYAFIRDGSELYRSDLKTSGANVGNSTWYHVVMMGEAQNGGALQFYVNGVAYSTTGSGNSWGADPLTNLLIGGANFPFNGVMDDVSMWSNTLSRTQVKALYNLGTNGTLHYTAGDAAKLFDVFSGKLPSATIGALTWEPASGILGNPGDVVDLGGGNFALILDDFYNGVSSAPVPPMAAFVDITNIDGTTNVPFGTSSLDIVGTNNALTVGDIWWTNVTVGSVGDSGGSVPAGSPGWTFNVTLSPGANIITVSGTNATGFAAYDSATVDVVPEPVAAIAVVTGYSLFVYGIRLSAPIRRRYN